MPWYCWGLILFVVGIVEFFISEYQNLHSVRLKVKPTILFSELNHLFDFFVNVFLFGMIIDFWEKFKHGNHNFKTLLPYLFYLQGCTIGTILALVVYKKRKKQQDREKRILLLEKARQTKKQLQEFKNDVKTEIEEEIEEDLDAEINIEQETESVNTEEISDKVVDNRKISQKETNQESPLPGPGQSPKTT
jgi:hypothetical protein